LRFGVAGFDTEEDQRTLSDLADDLSVYRYGRPGYTLY
jgi:hypothetical protein